MAYRSVLIRAAFFAVFAACLIHCGSQSSWGAGGDTSLYDSRVADFANAANFPDKSAVILADRKVHTWSFAETTIERAFAVKILTREGIDQFGDFISDVYDKEYYTCDVEATVVSPGGERKRVTPDRIKKVEIGKNQYQYRVAMPGVEIGSIVEIEETARTEYPVTSGEWDFSHRVPTLRSELVFKVPKGACVSFNFTPKNCQRPPSPEIDHKYDSYTITMEVLPPYATEPYMPPDRVGNPTVRYRIWQVTMDDYLRYFNIEYDKRLVQWMEEHEIPWELPLVANSWDGIAKSFVKYFDPETWKEDKKASAYRSELKSVIAGMPDSIGTDGIHTIDGILEGFHRIFRPVKEQFFFRNPEECLDQREGDPFELAYVLKRILEERHLQPSVVLASDVTRGLLDQRSVDPYVLSHPLLLISLEKKQYWIDPFSPECRANQLPWECQGVGALWLKTNEQKSFIVTPIDAASQNHISRREEIEIDQSGRLSGRSRLSLTGQYVLEMRRRAGTEDSRAGAEDLSSVIGRFLPNGAEVDSVTVERNTRDTLIVSCRYSLDAFGRKSGDLMQLDFSDWCGNYVLPAFESQSRKYDVMLPFPDTRSYELRIRIPAGYSVVQRPGDVMREDGSSSYHRSCTGDEPLVVLKRSYAIVTPTVGARDYAPTRAIIEEIRKSDKEAIVLKRS
jgi:hypothetical protein